MATARSRTTPNERLRAFTLTELLVVVGVVVIILALSIPAASVWESRKFQDSINLTSGLVQITQSTAISENTTVGLFFYVDPTDGAQYVWPIEAAADLGQLGSSGATADRFRFRDTMPHKLAIPYRAVPTSLLDTTAPVRLFWDKDQLVNNRLEDETVPQPDYDPADAGFWHQDGTQFHRNFFVILFDKDGRVQPDQQVVVWDRDDPDLGPLPAQEHPGFRTNVNVTITTDDAVTGNELSYGGPGLDGFELYFMSAAGVLIYNDESYQAQRDVNSGDYNDDHRTYLRRNATPMYIHAVTGRLIKGQPEI